MYLWWLYVVYSARKMFRNVPEVSPEVRAAFEQVEETNRYVRNIEPDRSAKKRPFGFHLLERNRGW